MKFNFPSLAEAKLISVDTETYDPGIDRKTGSAVRTDGYVVGISIATEDKAWYLPLAHQGGGNLDRKKVLAWCNKELGRDKQPKVGMRLMYDLDMLMATGIKTVGPLADVRLMDKTLMEHHKSYALDAIAERHLPKGERKTGEELWTWLAAKHGGTATRDKQIGKLWTAPAVLVEDYAMQDARLPIKLHAVLKKKLETAGLWGAADRENRLITPLFNMRQVGVRIDIKAAERLGEQLAVESAKVMAQIKRIAGKMPVDLQSATVLAAIYEQKLKIKVPHTEKGNLSVAEAWLESQVDKLSPLIRRGRLLGKFSRDFVKYMVLQHVIKGRIHAEFDQVGAHTGRFSCRNPNLQQVPARVDKELAAMVRGLFIPEEGCDWGSADYSQIEYRLTTHYGRGPSADKARQAYRDDPKTDYHQWVMDMTGLPRGKAKPVNFSKVYRAGRKKFAETVGVPLEEGNKIFDEYDATLPFIKDLGEEAQRRAEDRGQLNCLLGARRHFPMFESKKWDTSRVDGMMDEGAAREKYGPRGYRRAGCYKALSMLIQGSAAEIIKEAILGAHDAGVFDVAPLHLTVHDELDVSIPRTKIGEQAWVELKQIMEAVGKDKLKVPLLVDAERGADWGHVS